MCNADKDEYESDLRRNEQYLTNSENKVWKKKKKKFRPVWDLSPGDTGAVFYQLS